MEIQDRVDGVQEHVVGRGAEDRGEVPAQEGGSSG